MAEVAENPCAAEAMVGTNQDIQHKGHIYKGLITKWRYGTGVIEKMSAPADGSRPLAYPSFDVLLKPDDGSRARWFGPFKDGNNPFPSEVWLGDVETLNRREPGQLVRSIRRTLFGYCASEPVVPQVGDDEWGIAAFWAFEDICELVEQHFPEGDDTGL